MTSQYFFFNTYVGYFLQALPIAAIVAFAWYMVQYRKDRETPPIQKLWKCVFVCYMAGLVCLLVALDVMGIAWYQLLYHAKSSRDVHLFGGGFNLVPDFLNHISSEVIGNLLMYLPFGVLYPISHRKDTFKKTILVGFMWVFFIEVLQPVFGRAFDINDIILNTSGIVGSATVYFIVKGLICKKQF